MKITTIPDIKNRLKLVEKIPSTVLMFNKLPIE